MSHKLLPQQPLINFDAEDDNDDRDGRRVRDNVVDSLRM
jgi:hypothetical protein